MCNCFFSLRTRDRLTSDDLRFVRARVLFVEFLAFRQKVLFGPLATLQPLIFLHLFGLLTLFP